MTRIFETKEIAKAQKRSRGCTDYLEFIAKAMNKK
jgi:hypothetical protein